MGQEEPVSYFFGGLEYVKARARRDLIAGEG